MKQAYLVFAIMVIASLFSCGKDDQAQQVAPAQAAQSDQGAPFSPPSDGLLNDERARLYANTSTALLLLSQQWIERMDNTTDAQEKILILNSFDKARDQVCRKVGLVGIQEYNWISEIASKNPANKGALEKAGVQLGNK